MDLSWHIEIIRCLSLQSRQEIILRTIFEIATHMQRIHFSVVHYKLSGLTWIYRLRLVRERLLLFLYQIILKITLVSIYLLLFANCECILESCVAWLSLLLSTSLGIRMDYLFVLRFWGEILIIDSLLLYVLVLVYYIHRINVEVYIHLDWILFI